MIDIPLLKLRARHEIGNEEERAIREAVSEIVRHPADTTVVHAGVTLHFSILLLEGMMCRYKDLSNGQRQITALHVAGDFVDLHGFVLHHLDHSLMTLTRCRVAHVPHERLTEITRTFPHLTRMLWFSTCLDGSIHREWMVSIGRRTAIARVAHLFCELHARLAVVGLADDTSFALPITQAELAECVGLTPVHVNRVLRQLREGGTIEFRSSRATILDRARLEQIAEFDPGYLYLRRRRTYSAVAESRMSRR